MTSVLRKRLSRGGWTAVPNAVLYDPALTFKAKGLLGYMLAKPDGWKFAAERIAGSETADGRDAIRTGMQELRRARLLRWGPERADDGTIHTVFEVSDVPVPEWGGVDNSDEELPGGTGNGLSGAGSSGAGKPGPLETPSQKDPPTPRADADASPPEGEGRVDSIIEAAITARVTNAVTAGGIKQPAAFRRSVRDELDTPANRERVARWLRDFPGATDSLYGGCLADGVTTALRGYARTDLDAHLYAEHETSTTGERPALRLVGSTTGAKVAPGG